MQSPGPWRRTSKSASWSGTARTTSPLAHNCVKEETSSVARELWTAFLDAAVCGSTLSEVENSPQQFWARRLLDQAIGNDVRAKIAFCNSGIVAVALVQSLFQDVSPDRDIRSIGTTHNMKMGQDETLNGYLERLHLARQSAIDAGAAISKDH